MKPLTFEEVIEALQGTCDQPAPPGSITRVTTDSRSVEQGDLFIAIRGDRFDGHDFVGEVFERGAVAAVVRHDYEPPSTAPRRRQPVTLPARALLIRVDDPVDAMGRLATFYRRTSMGSSVSVVAVTGSNGKTTTKSMIAHVLKGRWPGRASDKSFNNQIGVPVTVLSVEPGDAFVVCEVGTNAPGEIAALSRIVEPEVAVITGVSEAHLEGLGTVDQVAEEKLSMLHHLRPEGCAVLNADCEQIRSSLERDRELGGLKRVTFGEWPEADLRLTAVELLSPEDVAADRADTGGKAEGGSTASLIGGIAFTVNGRFKYRLRVPGRHNVWNALAAIAVARRFSMDHEEIAERLATFALPPMRLTVERAGRLTLINDAYNANPSSLAAGLDVLVSAPAPRRRVLIVGDMRELGAASEQLHRAAAERIAASPVDLVIAIGDNARLICKTMETVSEDRIETHAYGSVALARRRLTSYLRRDDTILLKGSRAVGLDKLVPFLCDWAARSGTSGSGKTAKKTASKRRLTA